MTAARLLKILLTAFQVQAAQDNGRSDCPWEKVGANLGVFWSALTPISADRW
jgi:hypothetical protein